MAKDEDGSGASSTKGKIGKGDLRKAIRSINDLKDAASEHAGLAGKETQNAVELHGLDKTALTLTARLARMEADKRGGVVRSTIEYWDKMGFFDQITLWDDVVSTMEEIVKRARAKEAKAAPPDGKVVDLAGQPLN